MSIVSEGTSMSEDDPDDDTDFDKFSLRFFVVVIALATVLTLCGGPPDLFLFGLWPDG